MMRTILRRTVGTTLTALVALTLGASPASAAPGGAPPIAQVRTLSAGDTVTVVGTVTTPPGAFASSFLDVGFGIQDRTAGIYISASAPTDVMPGTSVRVTGSLADQSGLLVVRPTSIVSLGPVDAVAPRPVVVRVVGESTEASLVTVVGRVTSAVVDDLPYGYKFTIADRTGETTVFVNTQTGIDVSAIRAGQTLRVTGMSSQYEDHYEIDPRSPADVVVLP
ncbi:hypothetical protein HQ325_14065 [Rhodococcus sp. BP-349]|uniref:hypothetical protein n=1 Tax=unclassified Rhodococcus (in: high G+C Gram-positive bacteria) TaxID=192944 RepID=UPI001C9A47CD|nr:MULTISPECIES: hypothetical protein [unclassified Rhodococcus (in: high G+C Gram-positive bacteria)]MBY6539800.1 hypothetical protein [Rhodococcus sp. BP-363]MBY6543872.1 hypothetical protein [Rhodococcus sp. BP-369]MBY6563102.1 hypothetical protein [Rhodococcus sp. BP-370]MBY6577394.1 hypothetical protein [Rhodococcus sp. BP-364]MBY6586695.1 hypothetical protein [Rhodococcus sp. BP-358]